MSEIATLEQFSEQLAQADEYQGDSPQAEDVELAQPEAEAQGDDQPEAEETEVEQEKDGEEGQAEEQPSEDPVIEWETASGEKYSVPVSELKNGYMRQADYTQKTQELARLREAAQQQIQQQFQEVQQYAQELGQLQLQSAYIQQLEAQIAQINRHDDPVAYNAAVNELILAQQKQQQLTAQIAQVQQRRMAEQQQAFLAAQQKAAQELTSGPNALPGFGKELVQKLNETGRAYGLDDQELSLITDPRHIRILHDAMKYRELQAKKPAVVNKVKQAPIKPPKQTSSKPAVGVEQDLKRFKTKPDVDSLAKLLQHAM